MIPLFLSAEAEPGPPYVAKLAIGRDAGAGGASLIEADGRDLVFAGERGIFSISGVDAVDLDGDVVLISPLSRRAERLLRANSDHNSLLVTERCDQLCVMCSQPPKKTHVDRFALFEDACLLAKRDALITISGGEPTLYRQELFGMVETVLRARPDLRFHILSNGQHFLDEDIERLRRPEWRRVAWGIPLYAADNELHDRIVAKDGAAVRLRDSLARLILAGARIELRTVVLQGNIAALPRLAEYVATRLQAIEQWSIMQLENAGFARTRWKGLRFDHSVDFAAIARAVDHAELFGVQVRLFNFARCTVPAAYRDLAVPSISDWKRRYAPVCTGCREMNACSGFFEWHPDEAMGRLTPL